MLKWVAVVTAVACAPIQAFAENSPKKVAPKESTANAIAGIRLEMSLLRIKVDEHLSTVATIRSDDESYGVANTPFGPFIIKQKGLVEYLDGYKLTLLIGNITSATFSGAKLNISWGAKWDGDLRSYGAWIASRKKKEIDLTSDFAPGSYTKIEVVLPETKPEEAKEFNVGVDFNMLKLRLFDE